MMVIIVHSGIELVGSLINTLICFHVSILILRWILSLLKSSLEDDPCRSLNLEDLKLTLAEKMLCEASAMKLVVPLLLGYQLSNQSVIGKKNVWQLIIIDILRTNFVEESYLIAHFHQWKTSHKLGFDVRCID